MILIILLKSIIPCSYSFSGIKKIFSFVFHDLKKNCFKLETIKSISDEDMLAKVDFIHKCKTKLDIPVNTGAGLYDALQKKKSKVTFDDIEQAVKDYD